MTLLIILNIKLYIKTICFRILGTFFVL